MLEIKGLKTEVVTDEGNITLIDDITLSLAAGEVMGLVGESGSGKSVTGLSIMGLLDKPVQMTGGKILFKGRDLRSASQKELRSIRGNRIAMIFQDPMSTLNPVLRIDTQMMEVVHAHENVSKQVARERARDALGMVGIPSPEERLSAYPHQFSGGMRQRVAIAIALLMSPDVIIADEPTTALDVTIQAQILSIVQKLAREKGTALIWVTHDLSVVAGLAEKLSVMYAGRIVEQGLTADLLRRPLHPYTNGLIASLPAHNKRGERLRQISGTTPSVANMPKGCAFHPRCSFATEICLNSPALEPTEGRLLRCFHPVMEGAPS
ncbi:Oligopeptide transport ATP-binding protein oppD (plasmid) [Agrobacterium fabrum]|nr:Oligopeptide transport ATP-binding protein oppD [Agrobacterium tumefaciens]WJK77967.1 Oligopeptide transport ATP-binding protein oppD [Agrobacterium fabrum]CAD0216948.1 Oligopeptide transport ATP-binding protein OppD [Agrobacterium tumefaciens]SDB71010.1 peptide/nickel transport system ATP-binding protein [Agrobacterium fabrum]SER93485.1 peptide/nickel transport system ATP-binding protein [Agrobacterium fabrum]